VPVHPTKLSVEGATGASTATGAALPAAGDAVVLVDGVVKRYGETVAVNGVSFDVRRGEIIGLLGPNGAGKTTIVEIIEGLRDPDGGRVEVFGLEVRSHREAIKQRIGVQLQTPSLFPRLTVVELLQLFASFYHRSAPIDALIEEFGLAESRAKLVKRLSGGQQQRLSVALALINEPEIVFLDEPTNGLDPQARLNLWNVVRSLQGRGATVVLTTHYLEEAERLCDRVAIVDRGRMVALASPRELIRQAFDESAVQFRAEGASTEALAHLPAVSNAHGDGAEWMLYSADVPATMGGLLHYTQQSGLQLENLSVRGASLEDVFLKFTGRRFRD